MSPANHFASSVKYALSQSEPYHFFYTQNVFPWDFYWELLSNLPSDEEYPDQRFSARKIAPVEGLGTPFWKNLNSALLEGDLLAVVNAKFRATLAARFPGKAEIRHELRLCRDTSQYRIPPHTDLSEKAVSLLVYLPRDKSLAKYGTTIYAAKDPSFKSDGRTRQNVEDFHKVFTAPFMPNSMLGFARTDQSFHGVEPIGDVVRDVLLYNVYMR
jgi:hypothetical protein